MGFSVHETIVVFDRIRENLVKSKEVEVGGSFRVIVNKSINETLPRSVNTSLTLIIVLISLFVWGPEHLKYFILVILLGTVTGTYSSIFIASPLLVSWYERKRSSVGLT
jgi:preprotein translocase subunit SecF